MMLEIQALTESYHQIHLYLFESKERIYECVYEQETNRQRTFGACVTLLKNRPRSKEVKRPNSVGSDRFKPFSSVINEKREADRYE